MGRTTEGMAALETCIRLDPSSSQVPLRLFQIAVGFYWGGEYEAAVEAAHRALRSNPKSAQIYRWLAAALAQSGRITEAEEALAQAEALAPASFDVYVRRRVPWVRAEDHAHMMEGLRKAGWDG
jgi:adenylate cyclase